MISRNLARLATRSFSSSPVAQEITRVGVIGQGLMGNGIAQVAAAAGYQVVGVDASEASLQKAHDAIASSLSRSLPKRAAKEGFDAEERQAEILGRITHTTDMSAVADTDLVIEAIVENMDAKQSLFRDLDGICQPDTILASNTSSLSLRKMAEVTNRLDRFCVVHAFNPVPMMRLIELAFLDETNQTVRDQMVEWVKSVGKTPVTCGDTPGFIVNRLLVPYLAQALLMVDRGDASIQDIDTAMQLGAGHPMGAIALSDYVGLDTTLSILEGWQVDFPNEPAFVIPDCLREKVAQGKLGRKSGEGFYRWDGDKLVN